MIDRARAAALLKRACEFEVVSRPNVTPAPPEVTEANWSGTSFDKALWLLARLDNSAARLMVGDDRAWVEGTDANGVEWIFDPAKREPVRKPSLSGSKYLARRVWSGEGFVKDGERQAQAFREARLAVAGVPVASCQYPK